MVKLGALVILIVLLVASPADAKGPALTWEIRPQHPAAGEPALLFMRLWDWTPNGEPDLTRPPNFDWGWGDRIRWPARIYRASRFPYRAPAGMEPTLANQHRVLEVGIGVPPLRRIDLSTYVATVVFPAPGDWVVAQSGYHPGAPRRPDWRLAAVQVLPRGSRSAAGRSERPTADGRDEPTTYARPITAGAAIGGLLLLEAVLQRRREDR